MRHGEARQSFLDGSGMPGYGNAMSILNNPQLAERRPLPEKHPFCAGGVGRGSGRSLAEFHGSVR